MNQFKLNGLEWGMVLVFLLPPIGIIWLMFIGWQHFYHRFKRKKKISLSPSTLFFCGLLTSSLGAAVCFQNPVFLLATLMLLGYFGLYLQIKTSRTPSDFHTYKWLMIGGGLYIFLIGNIRLFLHQFSLFHAPYLGYLTGTSLLGDPDFGRLFGSTYNPNFAAFLLLISLAFLLVEVLKEIRLANVKMVIVNLILTTAIITAIIETESRQAIIVMGVLFLLFIFRYRLTLGIVLSGMALIFYRLWLPLIPRMDVTKHSLEFRETIWINSLHIWADHPIFGVTPLGFQDQYAMLSKYHIAHAHNLFLAYLSEYGLIGALVFIMILAFCTVHFIRMMKYVRRRKHCTADLFLFALPVIPFMGTLDFPLFSQQVMLLTIALLSYWEVYLKAKAKAVRSYPLYS